MDKENIYLQAISSSLVKTQTDAFSFTILERTASTFSDHEHPRLFLFHFKNREKL